MSEKTKCTVYIDEAGDLGFKRGTRWFIISAVIVDKDQENTIRQCISRIKNKLNIKEIHFRNIKDFNKRSYIVEKLKNQLFTYVNIIVDTDKLNIAKNSSTLIAYNYTCKLLLERVSWFLRDTKREGDIILSARGTSRDNELIEYIREKLIPYPENQIAPVFNKISAKSASTWDMLQLADVCATTMFLAYEINGWGFRVPCYSRALISHLYKHKNSLERYGLKYFDNEMKPDSNYLKEHLICAKKERTPGTTTT